MRIRNTFPVINLPLKPKRHKTWFYFVLNHQKKKYYLTIFRITWDASDKLIFLLDLFSYKATDVFKGYTDGLFLVT